MICLSWHVKAKSYFPWIAKLDQKSALFPWKWTCRAKESAKKSFFGCSQIVWVKYVTDLIEDDKTNTTNSHFEDVWCDRSRLNDIILDILRRMYLRLHAIILVTLTPVSVTLMIMERNRHICVIESVVYYVDPKSPGSLCFLGSKERVRLPLKEEHCSLEALKKHTVAHAGLKTEA